MRFQKQDPIGLSELKLGFVQHGNTHDRLVHSRPNFRFLRSFQAIVQFYKEIFDINLYKSRPKIYMVNTLKPFGQNCLFRYSTKCDPMISRSVQNR